MKRIAFRANTALWRAVEMVAERDGLTPSAAIRSLLQDALTRRGVPPYGDPREWVESKRGRHELPA